MQNFGFALAMNLALPMMVLGLIYNSTIRKFLPDILCLVIPSSELNIQDWCSWLWILWIGSFLWITRHIWNTSYVNLNSTDQIFTFPMYDSLLIDQSLALSRRRKVTDECNEKVITFNDDMDFIF